MSRMGGEPPGGSQGGGGGEWDIPLTPEDLSLLEGALANIYNTEERATTFLGQIRYPREVVPTWRDGSTPIEYWRRIFEDLDRGVMTAPYRRLLATALRVYASQPNLMDLQHRYLDAGQTPAPPPAADAQPAGTQQAAASQQPPVPAPQENCHLVAWLNAAERTALEAWLTEQGLDPRAEWITPTSVSFQVNQANPHDVDRVMSGRPDINWTVVAPGVPDYVLRYLAVQGPDGRSFQFNDVPSATPVRSVAGELVDQYTGGLPGDDQPTVVEHIGPEGPRRMNPDSTLAEEGITEGARFRVGFERRAAAVNPLDRRDALFRVRNQLLAYARSRPEFTVVPNSPALPTEYDIEFTQPSFGPPEVPGERPPDISVHQLSIVLPPDFPIVAPRVRWLSDVYHPNVWPTYESKALRDRPYARGLVCLGTLAESYQPSLDFGELCATLVDIAGYRNYSVAVLTDDAVDNATGQPMLRGDYYDENAAEWAFSARGQERISLIGGAPVFRALAGRPARLGLEIQQDVIGPDA
jgi:Effector-associated domain 1